MSIFNNKKSWILLIDEEKYILKDDKKRNLLYEDDVSLIMIAVCLVLKGRKVKMSSPELVNNYMFLNAYKCSIENKELVNVEIGILDENYSDMIQIWVKEANTIQEAIDIFLDFYNNKKIEFSGWNFLEYKKMIDKV